MTVEEICTYCVLTFPTDYFPTFRGIPLGLNPRSPMKNFLLLLLMLFAGIAHAQVYPDIHSQRPRIYVDSTRFAYLQANSGIGECGTTYTTFVNAVNNNWYNDPQLYLLGTDSTLWTWDFSSNWSHLQAIFRCPRSTPPR